jgi:predicted esterase
MTFIELQSQVIDLVEKKANKEAFLLMEQAKEKFPQKRDRLGHWIASLYVLEGKHQEALAELHEVIQHGLWWNPEILSSDPELSALKSYAEFNTILMTCQRMYEAEKESSHAHYSTLGNQEAETVLFPLHWKGSNIKEFSQQWADPKLNYFMGFPQSSQLFSYQCYSWDDTSTAFHDVKTTYQEFSQKNNVSKKMSILAGASQGGNIATQMSLRADVEEFHHFIAIVPAFDLKALQEILKNQLNPHVRGCIITGDQDPFYETVLEAVQLFETYQIPCKLIVKEGMGHEFPSDFPNVLEEAVQYVRERDRIRNK